jgi:hypothetical protein
MKILLFDEMSGVHKNLKEGLMELGYNNVVLASTGDSWKKIESDIFLGPNTKNLSMIEKTKRILYPIIKINSLTGHDIVQFIKPFLFTNTQFSFYNDLLFKYLIKHNNKSFLLGAGCSSNYYESAKGLTYSPCESCQKLDIKGKCKLDNDTYKRSNKLIANAVNGIIPAMYEYAIGYRDFTNLKPTIPLPINTNIIKYRENTKKNKITIFHGINRVGFKGTKIITNALNKIKTLYPDKVDIIIDGNMIFDKYLNALEKADIVVDQVYGYSYGMNAIYAMAMGKVVLSGSEKECLDEFEITTNPIINILPSEDDIIKKLTYFIEDKERIKTTGHKSRVFVENHHNHIKIAKNFIDIWTI